jgi:UDP-N-acetylmuramyl tripeptide synthase
MARPGAGRIALARAVGALARVGGRAATSAPGKALLVLDPGAIRALAARLARGSVLVSATNGKTTTTAMLAAMLERSGTTVVWNRAGANMAGGVASALLEAARRDGAMAGEMGLFEVDEMWLPALVAAVRPHTVLLGNLFRDQLDRYGELEAIVERWRQALAEGPGASARLVLCADDPAVADLGRGRPDTLYYGIEDDAIARKETGHAVDAKHCRRCGAPYAFAAIYLAHLGRYECTACGESRPAPEVLATAVRLEGTRSARFELRTPAGSAEVALPLPGLYNVYNALGAAAAGHALGLAPGAIAEALGEMRAAFGRAEVVAVDGRELRILLVKNPVGANEVLRTLALEEGSLDVLCVLNDNVADGRDVSWIWDADFELLAGCVRRATCSGTRAAELAARLKYAGVAPERIAVVEELREALARALADRPRGDATPLYALPTYTAMLALRSLLGRGGRHLGRAA